MSAYKKLNQQDAYITTHTARKSWIVSGSQYRELGIQNIVGLSGSGVYVPIDSDITYGGNVSNSGSTAYNKRLVYESNAHLYYSSFNGSVNTTSSSYENYLQSSYEVSGSRHLDNRVAIFSLPKEMYGIHLAPLSISITPDFSNGKDSSGSFDNYVINNYSTDTGVNSFETEVNLYIENTDFIFSSTGATCAFPTEDYLLDEPNYVDESTPAGGEFIDNTDTTQKNCNEIVDDGEGRLFFKYSSPRYYVGNVIYPHGQLIITDPIVAMYYNHYFDAVLKWKSTLPIFTHNYHCRLKSSEFNHTLNKTGLEGVDGKLADNISGSSFNPYITTVGLYNDSNELIAVGKMGQPLPKSSETDTVLITKFDMNFGVNRLPQGYGVEIVEEEQEEDEPVFDCSYNFVVQTGVDETGESVKRSSRKPRSNSKRRFTDNGGYRLYRRQYAYDPNGLNSANIPISRNSTANPHPVASMLKESTGNTNRWMCYTDIKVDKYITPSGTVSYQYDFGNYNPGADAINPSTASPVVRYNDIPSRSKLFFENIIEAYFTENNLTCNYSNISGPLTFEVTTSATSKNIELPYESSGTYSGTINWGDGNTSTNTYTNRAHTYTEPGVYTIKVSGRSSKLAFGDLTNTIASLYTKLVQFGDPMDFERLSFGDRLSSKHGAINMDFTTVPDVPSFAINANIDYMLAGLSTSNFNNIEAWDVSKVVSMQGVFYSNYLFNQNINDWDVSNVTTMYETFAIARDFNQPLNTWDVGNVTNMGSMFKGLAQGEGSIYTKFNQNINSWDVSKVTNMSSMFSYASRFNQPLNSWTINNVTNIVAMFQNAVDFNQPLSSWYMNNKTDLSSMFRQARSFNQPIDSWNVTNVTNMSNMFSLAYKFNQPLNSWNVSNVTNMANMFASALVFNGNISAWNVGKVTDMSFMFSSAYEFTQDIGSWDVGNVTTMRQMLQNTLAFNRSINNWDVSDVTNMFGMFYNAKIFNKPLNDWDVSNVTNMGGMFTQADAFNQPLSNWDVSNVTSMYWMFRSAKAFNQPIGSWDVSNVTNMESMFEIAYVFNQPIGEWDVSSVTTMKQMFSFALVFNQNISTWNVSNVTNMSGMFRSPLQWITDGFNQNLSSWSVTNVTNCTQFSYRAVQYILPKPNFTNCTP